MVGPLPVSHRRHRNPVLLPGRIWFPLVSALDGCTGPRPFRGAVESGYVRTVDRLAKASTVRLPAP